MRATLKTFWTAKVLAASAAALGVIGLAGAGYAYNEATIQLSATVNYACQVGTDFPTTTIQYTIDNLVNSDGTINSPSNNFELGNASCNYSSTMTISNEKGSLKRVGTPITLTDNFVDFAHYTAALYWGDQTTTLTGSGAPGSEIAGFPFT